MDALILSCGTGGGHDSAARAILEEMQRREHRATMLNPYAVQSEKLARRINQVYISMVQKTPRLFGAVYTAGQLYRKLPGRSPVYYANHRMVPVMQSYLAQHPADVVIMSHLYPAEIMTNMKNSGIPVPPTIFVSTDYVCIPFTEETDCDAYITPAPDLMEDYVRQGLSAQKLHPFGIPTSSRFASRMSRAEARCLLHLDAKKKYILITGGSMGGGGIRDAINSLIQASAERDDVELIVVCGSNKALYDQLMAESPAHTAVVGFTDEMATYMRAADLFITKPGGLSSTEAAVCGVPVLHASAIPGCESFNAEYFQSHGMSALCRDPQDIAAQAMALLGDEAACARMVERQHELLDGQAAARICALAEDMVAASR
ncbi:MAG: glycosyltransferase [Clostridiales bacterium]|nr:glycosyltransferase [Clostridiales bacterium]